MLLLWLKAFHVVVVVSWFAGIFYLPRLFVNHAMAEAEGDRASVERLKVMERRLYRFMHPFAVLTAVFGIAMIWLYGLTFLKTSAWLHAKLALVVLLYGYHVWLGVLVKRFARDQNTKGHRFYRVMNELPVLALFAIVVLVIVKPF